jgi:replicative DNA helicase
MSDQGDGSPIPHHPDAEAALISSCLTSTRALDHAATTVTPDDLYVVANRRVFAAMLRLHTRGEPVDPITVAHEVQTGDGQPGIDPANVTTYLAALGTTANSPTYARIVATMARYRRILVACGELEHAVRAFDDTAVDQALEALGKER